MRPDRERADPGLADRGLADRGLADHGLADRGLADRDGYLAQWSVLHGLTARGLVRGWLTLTYRLARPLALRRVAPNVLTLLGLLAALLAVPLAVVGGRWALLAAVAVVLSGLLDNLDGAVAVLTNRVSAWGGVLDSVSDRLSDIAYVGALLALGGVTGRGPALVWACAGAWAASALILLQEYVRARATIAGMSDVGIVTVAERPSRVIVTAAFCLGAGVFPSAAAGWGAGGLVVAVLGGVTGSAQLLAVVRRRLR